MDPDRYDEDEAAFVRHLDSLGVPHPYGSPDSRRIGLDRNTEEGALLALGSALRPDRPLHRLVAWVLLAAFGLPALFALLHLAGELVRLLLP
jgi:hypothetical protein